MKSSGSNDHKLKPRDQSLIERFLEMMSAERGAALNTLAAYERDLEAYAAFLSAKGRDLASGEAGHLRQYLSALESEGLKSSTAARRLSSVRQFHKFLYGEGLAQGSPATAIDSPKLRRGLPKVLSLAEMDRLLDTARTRIERLQGKARFRAERLHCLLELLYATGLRVSELVGLKARAVTSAGELITLKGKGGRERVIPVSGRARAVVEAYLKNLAKASSTPSP